MHAIILAAGRGSRLNQLDAGQRPKCLLEFGGRSLLDRMLDALQRNGVENCALVIGHEGARIIDHVSELPSRLGTAFHHNPRFEEGSVLSLGTASEFLKAGEPVLVLDADVLFHPKILDRLVGSAHENCFLLDRDFVPGAEPVKIAIQNDEMVEFGKQLPKSLKYDGLGESVGFFRFGPACAARIAQRCADFERAGRSQAPHEDVLREDLLEWPHDYGFEDVTGLPWVEIDFPEDVSRARDEILPVIQADIPGF